MYRAVRHKLAPRLARLRQKLRPVLATLTPVRLAEDAVLLLAVLQLAVLGANWVNSDNPVLGMRLEGRVVGGLDNTDFQKQADALINSYENKQIPVKAANATSSISLRQLGVNVQERQVKEELLAVGRTGNIAARLADQDLAALGARNVRLGTPGFNTEMAKAYIATLDQKIAIAPTNAYFSYINRMVMVEADKSGRAIDTEAALAALRDAQPEKGEQVELPTKQVPATVTEAMLNPLMPEVRAIVQKPLTIVAGDSRATLTPEQLVEVIVPKVVPDPKNAKKTIAQVTFDEVKLSAIVDQVVGKAVFAPKPTIMSGGTVIQQGKNGVQTEDAHSLARVLTALVQRQTGAAAPDEAHIPLVTVAPPVVHQRPAANVQTRTGTGLVRLTFDDGPGGYTEQILDILKRYNVHATFYVIGRNVQSYPGTMQRIKNEGHAIGNHSFNHPDLATLSRAGVQQELSATQAAIQAACGVTPTAFRPPYGSLNQTVREVAAGMGMSVDLWSVDTRDWAHPGSGAITQRVLTGVHPGAVVLLHVLNQQTVAALPSIIEGVRAQGFTLE